MVPGTSETALSILIQKVKSAARTPAEQRELTAWLSNGAEGAEEGHVLERFLISAAAEAGGKSTEAAVLDAAVELACKALAYRVENRVSEVLDEQTFPPAFREAMAAGLRLAIAGEVADDPRVGPVVVVDLARTNSAALASAWSLGRARGGRSENLTVLWYVRMMEFIHRIVLPRLSRERGTRVDQVITVLLCADGPHCVSLSHFLSVAALRWFKGMLHAGYVLYPAICERTIVLRAPWFAASAFRTIRPLLTPSIVAGVHIASSSGDSEERMGAIIDRGKTDACICGAARNLEVDFCVDTASTATPPSSGVSPPSPPCSSARRSSRAASEASSDSSESLDIPSEGPAQVPRLQEYRITSGQARGATADQGALHAVVRALFDGLFGHAGPNLSGRPRP